MTKYVLVEVRSKTTGEKIGYIRITKSEIAKVDERQEPHLVRANALWLALKKFSKCMCMEEKEANNRFRFKVPQTY